MARNLPPDPEAQRAAMAQWIETFGSLERFGRIFDIAPRQCQRYLAGAQMIPGKLCRRIGEDAAVRAASPHATWRHSIVADAFHSLAASHEVGQARQRAERQHA